MSETAAPSAAPAQAQQQQQPNAPKPHNAATIPGVQAVPNGGRSAPAPKVAPGQATTPVGQPEPKAEPRRFRLNVDGEDRELDESQLAREIARLQKDYSADKRFKEAAEMRKRAEDRERLLKEKPWDVIREHGHDPRALAEQYLYEEVQRAQMSPEQRAIAERDAKLREYETREQTRARAEQEAKTQQEVAHHQRQYEQTFVKALEHVGIGLDGSDPLAPWALQQMAMLEQANADAGYNAPPELLAEALQEQMTRASTLYLGKLDGEPLLGALEKIDPEMVKRINAATVARYEAKRGASVQPRQPAAQRQPNGTFAPNPDAKPKPSTTDYWAQFRFQQMNKGRR